MLERRVLHGQFLFDSPVVDGPQATHIIGCGIRTYSGRFQEVFIAHHQIRIHFIEKYIILATKTLETPDDSRVPFSGTGFPNLFHLPDNLTGKRNEALTLRRREVVFQYITGGIVLTCAFQACDNVLEPFGVPVQNFFQ